jgi:uncharacterized OsmC-like protein
MFHPKIISKKFMILKRLAMKKKKVQTSVRVRTSIERERQKKKEKTEDSVLPTLEGKTEEERENRRLSPSNIRR